MEGELIIKATFTQWE